ncbi:MAG: rhodanese-like domain-containing protein [Clostridiales bacterium]|uniref:rhodanese-like domain-containing protein n=1 Tax=Roseburia sp. MSJ-14 TaxID=2841514 RepID=UPI0016A2CC0F|nr:rhodanese-like domain-containing protein [Roseburia sp. MSJ-14]MBU5474065.1 rhodanese-like domain-containing protein [Roseburia sp. MSJ-14]NLK77519.1 rhodanese-like domain-containing protein [Clostridiales bacterium]
MEFQTISIKEFEKYRQKPDVWVIDLRTIEEYEEMHVGGARNIPYDNLEMYKKYLPKDKTYILYCDRGGTSLKVARELSREGYQAMTVVGGFQAILQNI